MGSCQSSPRDGSVAPDGVKATFRAESHKRPGSSLQTAAITNPSVESSPHLYEETDTATDGSDRENCTSKPIVTYSLAGTSPPCEKDRRSRIKPGYSSGGSSDYSDDASEPHKHLVDWKNELGADGDLCKGVVRIEVSRCTAAISTRVAGTVQNFSLILTR